MNRGACRVLVPFGLEESDRDGLLLADLPPQVEEERLLRAEGHTARLEMDVHTLIGLARIETHDARRLIRHADEPAAVERNSSRATTLAHNGERAVRLGHDVTQRHWVLQLEHAVSVPLAQSSLQAVQLLLVFFHYANAHVASFHFQHRRPSPMERCSCIGHEL